MINFFYKMENMEMRKMKTMRRMSKEIPMAIVDSRRKNLPNGENYIETESRLKISQKGAKNDDCIFF